jgi:predicted DNA-binding ribbon-helix-helix protein
MKSVVIKRSILLNGRKTSVSLENEFWDALHEIADRGNIALSAVVEQINSERDNINLSSAIRVFCTQAFPTSNRKRNDAGFSLRMAQRGQRELTAPSRGMSDAR